MCTLSLIGSLENFVNSTSTNYNTNNNNIPVYRNNNNSNMNIKTTSVNKITYNTTYTASSNFNSMLSYIISLFAVICHMCCFLITLLMSIQDTLLFQIHTPNYISNNNNSNNNNIDSGNIDMLNTWANTLLSNDKTLRYLCICILYVSQNNDVLVYYISYNFVFNIYMYVS